MIRQVGSKVVPDKKRNSILNMHDGIVQQCNIAKYYKLRGYTLPKIIKRGLHEKKNIENARNLSLRNDRNLMKVVNEQRSRPAYVITSTYNRFAPVELRVRTAPRTLRCVRIKDYFAVSKPYLSQKNCVTVLHGLTIMKNRTTYTGINLCLVTSSHSLCV